MEKHSVKQWGTEEEEVRIQQKNEPWVKAVRNGFNGIGTRGRKEKKD